MSDSDDELVAQFRQARRDRNEARRAEQGPGLHKVGPNPWDYEYNPAKGQKVTFVDVDGCSMTGTITDFTEDEESGELQLTVQQFPDAMQFPDAPAGVVGELPKP